MSERQQLAWALKQSEPEKERKKRAANARFKNPQKALQNITSTKGRDYLVTDNSSGAMQTPAAKEAKPKRKRKKILDDAFVTPPAKKKKTSSEGPGSDPLYSNQFDIIKLKCFLGWLGGGVVLRSSGGALMVVERRLEFASADKQQHGLPVMAVAVEFI
eukprot:g9026.t1